MFCGGMPIVPKHIFNDGANFNTHKNNRNPVGTGPYKFHSLKTKSRITLKTNENYWGKKPDIKKIVFKIIEEENIALQMLKKGSLDVMALREIQWVRQTNSEKFKKKYYKFKYYSSWKILSCWLAAQGEKCFYGRMQSSNRA